MRWYKIWQRKSLGLGADTNQRAQCRMLSRPCELSHKSPANRKKTLCNELWHKDSTPVNHLFPESREQKVETGESEYIKLTNYVYEGLLVSALNMRSFLLCLPQTLLRSLLCCCLGTSKMSISLPTFSPSAEAHDLLAGPPGTGLHARSVCTIREAPITHRDTRSASSLQRSCMQQRQCRIHFRSCTCFWKREGGCHSIYLYIFVHCSSAMHGAWGWGLIWTP